MTMAKPGIGGHNEDHHRHVQLVKRKKVALGIPQQHEAMQVDEG